MNRGEEKVRVYMNVVGGNRTHDLRIRSNGRCNPVVVGSIPTEVKYFFFTSCGYLIPFTRANAQWVIHGSINTLIYTS